MKLPNQKGFSILLILIGVIVLASTAFGVYQLKTESTQTSPLPLPTQEIDIVACTMDAMECPDGSFVGRQAPTCEFAPCPSSSSQATVSAQPTMP